MSFTPRTDKLIHELSQPHYNESKSERASRVENPLIDLCRQLEGELMKEREQNRQLTQRSGAGRWM